MADNCLSMDTWTSYRPLQDTFWMSDAFGRDNEELTRALQASLSNESSPPNSNSIQFNPQPEPTNNNFNFVVDSRRNPDPNPITSPSSSITGKIKKRKSRASKKSPTTYITADPANFRQMVQQVTGGVRFGADSGFPVDPVLRPEPQRAGIGMVLPTLDTSSPLLRKEAFSFSATPTMGTAAAGYVSAGPVRDGSGSVSGSGFDFDAFSSFPTLESWSAM